MVVVALTDNSRFGQIHKTDAIRAVESILRCDLKLKCDSKRKTE
jgi:hypothetical protein